MTTGNWNFRELEKEETRVLLTNSGDHKFGILKPSSIVQAMETGIRLRENGLKINNFFSSPSARALQTTLATQEGYGKMGYIETIEGLSDLAFKYIEKIPNMKKHMMESNLSWEKKEDIATVLFTPNAPFFSVGMNLGFEFVSNLTKIAKKNKGKTTLVMTHSVSRIEIGLMLLKGIHPHPPKELAQKGQIVEIVLRHQFKIVEENWLEPVKI